MATVESSLKVFNDTVKRLWKERKSADIYKTIFDSALKIGAEQKDMQNFFVARTGSDEIGKAMFTKFKKETVNSGMDMKESMQNIISFLPAVKNTDQLSGLNSIIQKLAVFDPAGGSISGAAGYLKSALKGDVSPLADRFNISKADIEASKIGEFGKSGNIDEFIKAFDKLLEKQRMGKEAFDLMLAGPSRQIGILINNIQSNLGDLGQNVVEALLPIVAIINSAFQSGKFQPFFDALNIALTIASDALKQVVNGLMWILNTVQTLWPYIEPLLAMITGAFVLWGVSQIPLLIAKISELTLKLWLMLEPIVRQAVAWMLVNKPILIIGALIGFLIYAMLKWGDTTVEVIGFVGGLFGVLFGSLFNTFAYFANMVLSVAEFFINVWRNPVYAVNKLFLDLVTNALGYLNNLAKGIENIINKIPGLKVDIASGMGNLLTTLNAVKDSLKGDKDVIKLMRFEQMDYATAFNTGRDMGKTAGRVAVDGVQGAFNKIKDIFQFGKEISGEDSFNFDSFYQGASPGNMPDINKVGEIGKINETVDISSEDIKMMRELAEMKNIQNFVSLTPKVEVKTGDINNGYDIDTIVSRITTALENQIASSAEGVYA